MSPNSNPIATHLQRLAPLPAADMAYLDTLTRTTRDFGPHEEIAPDGDGAAAVPLVVSGFLCRQRQLADGRLQITGLLVPGDVGDLYAFVLDRADCSLFTLTPCRIATLDETAIAAIAAERPSLIRALWRAMLADIAITREWLVGLGQRDAFERIAHFLCEMRARLDAVGLAEGHRFELPLTQRLLADTLGMSTVHVNRTLQRLRADGLLTLDRGTIHLKDPERLQRQIGFNPDYLHWYETQ